VEYSCILTESGEAKLFSPTNGKIGNKLTDKKITSISSGQEHILLLTDSGRVLSFGRGSRGQLGHGDVEDVTESSELIDALDGIKIKSIAAGGWHSLALSMDGDVYVWGWNESGQLGYSKGTINMKALPLPLEISDDDSFIAISAGSRHSMAVSENGILFGWGWNKWGQLGLDPKTYIICDTPQVIPVDEKVFLIIFREF
jgi:alpha-tubulin suppressor-like RCC1 family protein